MRALTHNPLWRGGTLRTLGVGEGMRAMLRLTDRLHDRVIHHKLNIIRLTVNLGACIIRDGSLNHLEKQ